jgi:hypothetical protein
MTLSLKNLLCSSRKFQMGSLELYIRQTEFMSENTFNTLPLASKNSSYTLAYPSYSPPGHKPFLGWPHIFSISRHKSRCKFQKNRWMASLLLQGVWKNRFN